MTPCNDTHKNLAQRMRTEIPVQERADWKSALAGWLRPHTDLTARLVAIETELDDRVTCLVNITAADRRLLADHSRHAMIDYPYGAV
jgi:hypothetical protein